MKKLLQGKFKAVMIVLALLLISSGVLFTSVNVAYGAPLKDTVVNAPEICNSSPAPVPSATPSPYISKNQATMIFLKTASELFGTAPKFRSLSVVFSDDVHAIWSITTENCECYLDAASGAVINFYLDGDYKGKKITLGDFDNDPAYSDGIYNDPNNIYIREAKRIVKSKLAQGRSIDGMEVDGIQFVWDDPNGGFDPSETGTIQVDVHVYMHTGYSYTLSFWGTKNPELRVFSSHPTQDACRGGYFYPEDNPFNS